MAGLVAAGTVGDPRPSAGQSGSARGVYVDGARVGVKFHVLRERGRDLRRVSTTSSFRSGDRFKLEVETNRSAFVYVLNRTLPGDQDRVGSRGIDVIRDEDRRNRSGDRRKYTLLYPRGGESRPVRGNTRVQLPPGNQFFRMDDEPGIERVYVLASENEIDVSDYFDLDNGRQRTGRPRGRPRGGDSSIEDDVLDQLNAHMAELVGNALTEFAPEDADSRGIEVSSYGVVRDDGRSGNERRRPGTAVEVSLRHLPARSRR